MTMDEPTVGNTRRERMDRIRDEAISLQTIMEIMEDVPPSARDRMIRYLCDRYLEDHE